MSTATTMKNTGRNVWKPANASSGMLAWTASPGGMWPSEKDAQRENAPIAGRAMAVTVPAFVAPSSARIQ